MPQPDEVDLILEEWAAVHRRLDVRPLAIVGRLRRLSQHLDRVRNAVLAPQKLGTGDLDVLATLRRTDGGSGVKPTALFRALMITSGGMTARLDRLERAGLVARSPDPDDRRALRVKLTSEGKALVDRVLPEVLARESQLLSALTAREQAALAATLRKLLVSLEGEAERSRTEP